MHARRLGCALALSFAAFASSSSASAHISLEQGGTHLSRYGDNELKAGPCGQVGGTRGTNVYTYEPGSTITVSLVEFIAHPGYFRIAFDDDGDDGFKEPVSILPVDPKRKCPDGPGDHCGASDFYNSAAVLPGMDNLDPHLAAIGPSPKYTWQVKLPNVECNNCTLQIIQVMEDDGAHGPFDTTAGVGVEDIYHQCIDLVLKRGAGLDAGPSTSSGGSGSASPSGGGSDGGGCAIGRGAAGASSAFVAAIGLGLLASRRRRR